MDIRDLKNKLSKEDFDYVSNQLRYLPHFRVFLDLLTENRVEASKVFFEAYKNVLVPHLKKDATYVLSALHNKDLTLLKEILQYHQLGDITKKIIGSYLGEMLNTEKDKSTIKIFISFFREKYNISFIPIIHSCNDESLDYLLREFKDEFSDKEKLFLRTYTINSKGKDFFDSSIQR